MGFFRRSGPTLEQCIEKHDYECVVRFYLEGTGNDADKVIGALLLFGENDPQPLADVLGGLDARDMQGVAQVIVQSGGPDHPAVLALARYAGPELGRALGRAVIRCVEDAIDALVTSPGNTDMDARLGTICLLEFIGKAGIPSLKEILYRADGEEQRKVAACLQRLGWSPENPDEKPMFFYLCNDWKEIVRLKERSLPLMFSLVKSDDPVVRQHVLQALEEIGDSRAVPAILPHVDDCDPLVRIAAVSALTRYDTPETQQSLVSALCHADSQIRIDAAHALKRKGWVPQTQDEQIRYTIACGNWDAVIRLGNVVIPELIRIVRAGDNELPGAVYALAGLGSYAAQELEEILPSLPESQQNDIVDIFRKYAGKHQLRREIQQTERKRESQKKGGDLESLEENGPKMPSDSEILENQKRMIKGFNQLRVQKVASEQIHAIINEGVETHDIPIEMPVAALSSDDEAIRAAAIDMLSVKGEPAYPYIMKAVVDKSPIVRTAVADAIGSIGRPSMIKILSHLSKDSFVDVRLATVRALQMMDDKRAFPHIVHFFSDEDAIVRDGAAHAAAAYGQPGLSVLIRLLHMKNPDVRIAAAVAVGEIRDVRSLPYILPHLGDSDPRVREAIQKSVAQHDYRAIDPLKMFIAEAEGDAKSAALLVLNEIDPDSVNENDSDNHNSEGVFAAENAGAVFGKEEVVSVSNEVKMPGTESESQAAPECEMPEGMSGSYNFCVDSRICKELVLRIEGGDESLCSALISDLNDEKSSLKTDLMCAMQGEDRDFAMYAGLLLSKIGWVPDSDAENTLFLLSTGKTNDLVTGGDKTARILSVMAHTMPHSVQNTIVDVLSGIKESEELGSSEKNVSDSYPGVSDEDEKLQEGSGKWRLQKIIRKFEKGR